MDQGDQVAPSLDPLGPLEPHQDSNYIAFVMIALDHHAQLNRSICYILVYTSTCAFPILLGYSLVLYYQAQHHLLTRGCDHLIGRCRDIKVVVEARWQRQTPCDGERLVTFRGSRSEQRVGQVR
jgi:hypothetical protein